MKLQTAHKPVALTFLKCYHPISTFSARTSAMAAALCPKSPLAGRDQAGSPRGGAGWSERSHAPLDATSTFHNLHVGLLFQKHPPPWWGSSHQNQCMLLNAPGEKAPTPELGSWLLLAPASSCLRSKSRSQGLGWKMPADGTSSQRCSTCTSSRIRHTATACIPHSIPLPSCPGLPGRPAGP